jgi:hypothetical protein
MLFTVVWWTTGFTQNLRFTEPFAIHIQARANLDVRWDAPTNKIPASVSFYRLLPRPLSPQAMSSLLAACSFTNQDITNCEAEFVLRSSDRCRVLQVIPAWGVIDYRTELHRSLTNLVSRVPNKRQVVKLAKKFMQQMGINLADVEKRENSSEPQFYVFERGVTYFANRKAVYNIEGLEVRFKRAIDGISVAGAGSGGDFSVVFGGHGKVTEIVIRWRNIVRDKSYPTLTPEMMMQSIREGKAIQGMTPDSFGSIDWHSVKSVTIKKAKASYYGSGDYFSPSDWLQPYAALWTTVDTGHGNVDLEIDCPIINETSPK